MPVAAVAVRYGPDFLTGSTGRRASGVAVTVTDTLGGPVLVYNGPERRVTPNPFNSGPAGEVDIWLDAGAYRLSYTDPVDGATTKNIIVSAAGALVAGRYPLASPVQALLGQLANVADPTYPARSNLEWFGLGNPSDGALAATGVCCAVPIPIDVGVVVAKVSILVGATAESGGSHAFAALYGWHATAPPLIGQSTDLTGATAVSPASARFDFTLTTPQRITAAHAPYGYIYASISMTGTPASAASVAIPTAVGYQWVATGPLFISATHGSAVLGVAPATIASPAAKAVAPIVILT